MWQVVGDLDETEMIDGIKKAAERQKQARVRAVMTRCSSTHKRDTSCFLSGTDWGGREP